MARSMAMRAQMRYGKEAPRETRKQVGTPKKDKAKSMGAMLSGNKK